VSNFGDQTWSWRLALEMLDEWVISVLAYWLEELMFVEIEIQWKSVDVRHLNFRSILKWCADFSAYLP
jgi:hypothetical protein